MGRVEGPSVTDPVFLLSSLGQPAVDETVRLDGPEGHHAVTVRRLTPGERIVVADGRGRGVAGTVSVVRRASLDLRVDEVLSSPEPQPRYVIVQALAKGEHGERACAMLTEVGVAEIVPWSASRSVARWPAERRDKARARWAATVREATKQSRRLRVPALAELARTEDVCARLHDAALAVVLHEAATEPISAVDPPAQGEVVVVVGPEGGITPDEVAAFRTAGAVPVSLVDGVLRTSTAGVVALAGLMLR